MEESMCIKTNKTKISKQKAPPKMHATRNNLLSDAWHNAPSPTFIFVPIAVGS